MNKKDQPRFVANIEWFNRFFADVRELYELVVETMPDDFFPEGFALSAKNYYFPKQNSAPSIPPYYVLMVAGRQFALQIVAVFDPTRFGKPDHFTKEPSIVVVLHSQANRYSYIEDYALRVIGNRGIDVERQEGGKLWGTISKPQAEFFSFQIPLDRFSEERNPHDDVREHIVRPIEEELENRFGSDRIPTKG